MTVTLPPHRPARAVPGPAYDVPTASRAGVSAWSLTPAARLSRPGSLVRYRIAPPAADPSALAAHRVDRPGSTLVA